MVMVNGLSKRGLVGVRSSTNLIIILMLKLNIWISVEMLTARVFDVSDLYFMHAMFPDGGAELHAAPPLAAAVPGDISGRLAGLHVARAH